MKHRVALTVAFLVLSSFAAAAVAGPILKPRKYHGPIPKNSLTLRIGFLGGATNEQMYNYFDTRVPLPARNDTQSNDFGESLVLDLTFIHKLHPQFAVRANLYAAFLTSDWNGVIVPNIAPPDTASPQWQRPTVNTEVTFDVLLLALETSAVYYFTDAAVKEFQPYLGGGFTFGFPYQQYTETSTILDPDADPGLDPYDPIFQKGQVLRTVDKAQWSFEAGVHGVLGALYYFGNRWAVSVEGRVQILQSKFPIVVLDEEGEPEEVDFDVDFSGFILAAGLSYAF